MVSNSRVINKILGSQNQYKIFHKKMKCYNENGSVHSQTKYVYNVLFLCYVSNRQMIRYTRVQSFSKYLPKTLRENVTQEIKLPFLERVVDLRLRFKTSFTGHVTLIIEYYEKKCNKKSRQEDETCYLVRKGISKRIDAEVQALARILTIHFHHHLLTNNHQLPDLSRYCTSYLLLLT